MTDFDEWGLRAPALHCQQPLPALGLPRTSPPGQEQCGESTLLHLFNPKSYFYLFVCLGVLLRLQPSSFLVFFFFGVAITVTVDGIRRISCSYLWQTVGSASHPHPGQPQLTEISCACRISESGETAGFKTWKVLGKPFQVKFEGKPRV